MWIWSKIDKATAQTRVKHLLPKGKNICSHHLHKDSISRTFHTIKETNSFCWKKKKENEWTMEVHSPLAAAEHEQLLIPHSETATLHHALSFRSLQMNGWLQDLAMQIVFSKNQSCPQMASPSIQQNSRQTQNNHVVLLKERDMFYTVCMMQLELVV